MRYRAHLYRTSDDGWSHRLVEKKDRITYYDIKVTFFFENILVSILLTLECPDLSDVINNMQIQATQSIVDWDSVRTAHPHAR